MKYLKHKFLLASVIFAGTILGQPVFEDDFESYMVGSFLAENNPLWQTWNNNPGTEEDGIISDDFSYSGYQSLHVYGVPSGGPMDVYLPLGLETPHEVSFQLLVTEGNSAYFNVQEYTYDFAWAFDVVFGSNGFVSVTKDGADVMMNGPIPYNFYEWNEVSLLMDPQTNLTEIYINGEILGHFQFDNIIGGLNLFGYGDGATPGDYFVDDVVVEECPQILPYGEEEEEESTSENSCSELFISEYVEGNGNDKAVEFYNPTGDYIDLDGYTLIRYGNGNTSPSDSAQLWGTVAPYSTWVLVNGQTEDFDDGTYVFPACNPILQSLADQLDSDSYPAPTYFNGDDALVLTRYGEVIDIFGKVGEDPGSAWTDDADAGFTDYNGGAWLTNNHTLQRKYDVSEGVTSNPLFFDTFLEWDSLPVETWEGLGYHDCYCNEFSDEEEEEEEEEEEVEFNLCESEYEFGDIEFGISPNPEEGEALEDGYLGSAYDETIHFLLPSTINYLDPTFPEIPLDSARIESIHFYVGDPTDIYYSDQLGLDLICNNNGDLQEPCNFLGDSQYCLSLQGFPNISGEFVCVITFEGFVSLFGVPVNSFLELPHISLTIHEEQMVEGCTDEMACNYNPDANFDDGSCVYESCYGCSDPEAINYSEEAINDDGSCVYLDLSCDNLGEESWALVESGVYPATSSATFGLYSSVDLALHVNEIIVEPTTGQVYEFVNFELTNVEGLPLGIESDLAQTQITPIDQVCITLHGIPYEFGIFNVQFTGVATISLFGLELELNNFSFSHLLVVNENPSPVTGCTYFGAINYNPEANLDDGSCEIDGCTDPEAFNYSPLFTVEDGSCIYNTSDSECVTDINNDGIVTIEDLLTLLGDFGQECE